MKAGARFGMYFLSYEVRNTLCTCSSSIGRSSQQITEFNLSLNKYGTIYLGLNLARNPIYFALMFHLDFFASTSTTSIAESLMLSSNVNVDRRS